MRNIKKILMVTLLLCMAIAATVVFSSCESDVTPHVHEFTETVVKEATCTEEGLVNQICSCGYETAKKIPANGHTKVVDAAVPAECTKSGLTAGSHCDVCGLIFERQLEVKPLGHAMGADATCTEDQVCANGCGLVYAPAKGHLVTSVATCTESADCVTCGAVVNEALGHSIVIVPGIPVGCLTNGVSDGQYCDRCHVVLAEQEIVPATGHAPNAVVTAPTCEAQGYTTYTCQCAEVVNYVSDYVPALGHNWETEAYEATNGFEKLCGNECGLTKAVAAPVADSYKAAINDSFVSDRLNSLVMKAGQYGAWGVVLNGAKLSTEYDGGIGSFDEAGRSVAYEFYLDKAGFVDIIWTIASSNWDSATSSNIGIADMAAHMTITIDGKPVDIKGLQLPDGGQWWNLMNFVVDGVALEAGVHTFECKVNVHGGLNVGYMTIKSNRDVNARSVNVLTADIVEENGRVYYDLKAQLFGYTVDQLQLLDGALEYKLHSYSVNDGITTLRYDVTQEYKLYPHLKADGKWYVNGFNNVGDMGGVTIEEGKTIDKNGRTYTLATIYSMPVLKVALNEGTEASATPVSADLIEENGQIYWTFTYKLVGYYPEYLRVIDGSAIYTHESYTENADGTVTLKINVTDANIKVHYPHLQVMEVLYTGAGHTDAGDILAPTFPTKSILIGTKEYKIYNKYSMPVLEVVDNQPTMINTAYDLVEYNGKACLKLTYRCISYDETTAKFFDGSKELPYTVVRDGAFVTYYVDLTNTVGADFWCHMSIEGKLWNSKEGTTSSNGDILCPDWTGAHTSGWTTLKELYVNGQKYVLGVKWSMFIIGH